jgi:N-acyl homoserine lactone hydrolase
MTVKLYAFTCGAISGAKNVLMEGAEGDITIPVPAYLIEHPKGRALFDAGLHPDLRREPEARLGPHLSRLFRVDLPPGAAVSERLEAIDRDPGAIDLLISSHLHFDHVGGNALIPNATMLIQRREWEVGRDHEAAVRSGYDPRDYDLGHKRRIVDGEHDVFGDGSVVCLPTHGHTVGHQSLKLRLDGGEVVLAGDACYFCQTLRERRLPPAMFDRAAMLASLDRLEALERQGARIFFGHDPEFWPTVPQAPAPIG